MKAATQNAQYFYRQFPNQNYKAYTQQKQTKPPPGRNVAFREPIEQTYVYTPLATDSQSGTPIDSPAAMPPTPAIGGRLPLPVLTPTVGYAPTLAPTTPYPSTTPLDAPVAPSAMPKMAPATANAAFAFPPPPRGSSPQPVAPPTNAKKAVSGGKPSAANADGQATTVFNIYTRDMLPCLPARGIACDPKWKGASAEKINVLMPVDLLSCWLILFNVRQLKEVHFWHVRGNDSGRKIPMLEIRSLELFCIYNNEAWLTNLLDSLQIKGLKRLEVYHAASCASRFVHDEGAYTRFFARAIRLERYGTICISPNHPYYALKRSRLEGHLHTYVKRLRPDAEWTILVRDTRPHQALP